MKRYNSNDIEVLAKILLDDGVICVPTDTVYGICARINSKYAYDKLVRIKNRSKEKIFPVMCANKKQIEDILVVDDKVSKIIDNFMPGPITLILNKKEDVIINNSTEDIPTVAVRMAPTKELKELILKVGSPIFMTSANQSCEDVCKSLDEVEEKCPDLDAILEGEVFFNEASAIVDCTSSDIKVLRNGPISLDKILKIL